MLISVNEVAVPELSSDPCTFSLLSPSFAFLHATFIVQRTTVGELRSSENWEKPGIFSLHWEYHLVFDLLSAMGFNVAVGTGDIESMAVTEAEQKRT